MFDPYGSSTACPCCFLIFSYLFLIFSYHILLSRCVGNPMRVEAMTQDYPVIVEAPSNRSKCQSCGELIALGSYRVGLPYYHGGFTVVKWHHPSCFKRHCLLVDYAPTGRAKDTSDGTPISKGQPRLVIGEGASYRKYRHARLERRTSIRIPEADLKGKVATHAPQPCLAQDVQAAERRALPGRPLRACARAA